MWAVQESIVSITLFIWNCVEKNELTCLIGLLCFLWTLSYVDPLVLWYVYVWVLNGVTCTTEVHLDDVQSTGIVLWQPLKGRLLSQYACLCRLFLNIQNKKTQLLFIVLEFFEISGTKVVRGVPLDYPGNLYS